MSREFVDEFGRLSAINTTASQALAIITGVHQSFNATSSVAELVGSAAEMAAARGRLLAEAAHNSTTPSISEPS